MAKVKEPFNPFYAVLLLAGVVFAVTACAYGVMAFKALGGAPLLDESASGLGFLDFLDRHGALLLGIELVVLGIATGGVIGWDQWASARQAARNGQARQAAVETPELPAARDAGESP